MKEKSIAVIGNTSNNHLQCFFTNQLDEVIEQPQYKLTKYQTMQTYKSGKELRRERRKQERKNK